MRAALQEIMRHVHPFSRPWFSYLPPQDVHCNEFPTTADFWYDVHTPERPPPTGVPTYARNV